MRNTILHVLSFMMISSSASASFDRLPNEMLVGIIQYLEPDDAINLTYINRKMADLRPGIMHYLYAGVDKEYSKSLMQFDHAQWRIEEKMPPVMRVLVHRWYFRGLKTTDPYKRFCYMMAAGRAGHNYAALEAGQLLLNSDKKAIPCPVLFDDIKALVSEWSDPVVRDWDICKLNQEIIDDPDLRRIRNQARASFNEIVWNNSDPNVRKKVLGVSPEGEMLKYFNTVFEKMSAELEQKLSSSLGELKSVRKFCIENEIVQINIVLMRQQARKKFCEVFLPQAIYHINLEQGIIAANPNLPSSLKNQIQVGIQALNEFKKHLEKIIGEASCIDVEEFKKKYAEHHVLPCYWDTLARCYGEAGLWKDQGNSLYRLLQLRLSWEVLSEMVLMSLRTRSRLVPIRNVQFISGLLGEVGIPFENDSYHFNTECRSDLSDADKQEMQNYYRNSHLPMMVFVTELNLLRHPDDIPTYVVMNRLYSSKNKSRSSKIGDYLLEKTGCLY